MAFGASHVHCVVLTNSEKFETMTAGETAEFVNRHIDPPCPVISGLNVKPTLIQSEPLVKSYAL